MRRFYRLCWLLACSAWLANGAWAGEYHLTNGDIFKGNPVAIDDDGVVFKLDSGSFSQRVRWTKFTQETLKELAKDPKAARFAEAFIEAPPEPEEEEKMKKAIVVKQVETRLPRHEKVGFMEAWTTPGALFVLLAMYAANLYAAYEVARYRHRPAALVCGLSAILPVFGPLVFLSLPTLEEPVHELHPVHEATEPVHMQQGVAPPAAPAAAGGLGIAKAAKAEGAASGVMEPAVYKRGDFTINRRFVETKFAGFFRLVPLEAEKDLVLVVRTPKSEVVAKRVSRISSNEMHLQLLKGGTEQSVAFGDITEIQVRHKDAK